MDPPTKVQVFFSVGHRQETALFRTDTPADQVKDLFRAAAEAGPRDILKLYSHTGHLLNINPELPSNNSETRYSLQVVAAHCYAMLQEETSARLKDLEARLSAIEHKLHADLPLPPAFNQLQCQVDAFREKLETTESLSWLGFYKQLPEPLTSEECRLLQYRRKSDSIKQRVKQNFLNICDAQVSDTVRQWVRMPTFDSRQWEDEELLLLLQQMFLDLDLCNKFAINVNTLRNFLYEVYKNYNEVPFHNFRHCFCVAQMMYAIAWCVDLPSKIGDLEVLILIASCICHDLDHPGYNNIYQINAKTELALRYNDISPLENHHCSVAFRILENDDCNIFKSFSSEAFKQVREGMIRCILATDMARHNEILCQFKEITPEFDYTNKAHTNSLCMVLIKVADISNEARPMDVAEPWLDRLLQEFFKQSDAEKLEGLPVTPFMDREKITKPSSQCSFIGFVLLPLFEALGDLLTELQDLIIQPVRDALDYYRRLNEATKEERLHRKSLVAELSEQGQMVLVKNSENDSIISCVPKSASNTSVRLRKSLSFQQNRSRSRSADDDTDNSGENKVGTDEDPSLEDVAEDPESGESETANEVEVSEKTSKFKISTEGNIGSGRKSYPGSRKGSRERVQQLNSSDLARVIQRGKLTTGAYSFDQRCLFGKKSLDAPDFLNEFNSIFNKTMDIDETDMTCRNDVDDLLNKTSEGCHTVDPVQTPNENHNNSVIREDSIKSTKKSLLKTLVRGKRSDSFDDIYVDKELSVIPVQGDSNDVDDKVATNGNNPKSLLSRFKQFTGRLGLTLDRDNKWLKNNNSRVQMPARTKNNKQHESPCCKSLDLTTEQQKSCTLPNTRKSLSLDSKRGWKNILLGKDKSSNDLGTWSAGDYQCGDGNVENRSLPSTSKLQLSENSGQLEETNLAIISHNSKDQDVMDTDLNTGTVDNNIIVTDQFGSMRPVGQVAMNSDFM